MLVRNPVPLELYKTNLNLTIRVGSVLSPSDIDTVLTSDPHVDAVVVTLGTRILNKGAGFDICSAGQRLINESAGRAGIKHMILITSFGVGESKKYFRGMFESFFIGWVLKNLIADKEVQEQLVREDGRFAWTFVRPGGLTNGEKTKIYKVGEELTGGKIARANVAHFVIGLVAEGEKGPWIGKAPTVVA